MGNLVLWRHASGAVKRDFRTYIRQYTAPNDNFEYGYPHSNAFLHSPKIEVLQAAKRRTSSNDI